MRERERERGRRERERERKRRERERGRGERTSKPSQYQPTNGASGPSVTFWSLEPKVQNESLAVPTPQNPTHTITMYCMYRTMFDREKLLMRNNSCCVHAII